LASAVIIMRVNPRGYTGESMIVMGDRRERLEGLFAEVTLAGHVSHPYSMPYQHIDIYYCRGLKQPLKDLWLQIKNWNLDRVLTGRTIDLSLVRHSRESP
jgi:hypothetical protein